VVKKDKEKGGANKWKPIYMPSFCLALLIEKDKHVERPQVRSTTPTHHCAKVRQIAMEEEEERGGGGRERMIRAHHRVGDV
jgi:hypothetical protein